MSALRIISNALTTLHCFRFFKSFSDVKNYSQVFGTPVSYLSSLPHGQRNGGRPTIDLQKQILITIWILCTLNERSLKKFKNNDEFLPCKKIEKNFNLFHEHVLQ